MCSMWCAQCGAYVDHDPADAHHSALDVFQPARLSKWSRAFWTDAFASLFRTVAGLSKAEQRAEFQ
jgi:hypothetical protein